MILESPVEIGVVYVFRPHCSSTASNALLNYIQDTRFTLIQMQVSFIFVARADLGISEPFIPSEWRFFPTTNGIILPLQGIFSASLHSSNAYIYIPPNINEYNVYEYVRCYIHPSSLLRFCLSHFVFMYDFMFLFFIFSAISEIGSCNNNIPL